MALIRWILALVTIAYALFNAIAPVSTLLYKLQTDWPQGWATLQKSLSFPTFSMGGAGTNRFALLMDATNWLQVAMWLLADILYIASGFRMMGSKSKGAAPVFAVALLLDVATWLTFKRMPIYDATFSANDQQQTLVLFAVVAGLGVLIFLTGSNRRSRARLQPAVLME